MKKIFTLLTISICLFFVSKAVVFAKDELTIEELTEKNGLELRCADFLNTLPQMYTRNTKTSFGTNDTAITCEYFNKDKESSGSQLDADIVPSTITIIGDKKAGKVYQQAKDTLLTNKRIMGLKIIAEDVAGENSYVAQGTTFTIYPTKGYTAVSLNLVFSQGPCFVRMSYLSRLNDAASQYHPVNPRTSTYDNLHPEFDHGKKRMREEMEAIARNIAGMCTNNKIVAQNSNQTVPDTITPISKTEEELYNDCVDKCFLDKVLSICSANNSAQCSFDLVNARKDCLRTCKAPAQFQKPKSNGQKKIITKQDYKDQEIIILNGLSIKNNSSVDASVVNYSEAINKLDFESAKVSKPSNVSGENLEIWVADIKGNVNTYSATESAQPKWSKVEIGNVLSEGARIFVDKDSNLLIGTDIGVLRITGVSDFTITKAKITGQQITFYINLNLGTIEADMDKGKYELDMQINTLSSLTKITGTHFFVNFDEVKRLTGVGVFDGEMEVENLTTGERLLLVPQVGGKHRIALIPLEIAVPTIVQEPVSSAQKGAVSKTKGNMLVFVLILIIIGAVTSYLYKRGKLVSLYKNCKEKISGIIGKTGN